MRHELYSCVCPNGGSLEPGPRVRNYSAKGGHLDVLGVYKGCAVRKEVTYALRFVTSRVNHFGPSGMQANETDKESSHCSHCR